MLHAGSGLQLAGARWVDGGNSRYACLGSRTSARSTQKSHGRRRPASASAPTRLRRSARWRAGGRWGRACSRREDSVEARGLRQKIRRVPARQRCVSREQFEGPRLRFSQCDKRRRNCAGTRHANLCRIRLLTLLCRGSVALDRSAPRCRRRSLWLFPWTLRRRAKQKCWRGLASRCL